MKKETIYQNFWDTAKAVLTGTFLVIKTYDTLRRKKFPNEQFNSTP